jgi:hypothetical protein
MARLGIVAVSLAVAVGVFGSACRGAHEQPPVQAPSIEQGETASDSLDALSQVCRGVGVKQAAPYTGGSGLHSMVLLDASGGKHPWTGQLPADWRSESISTTQLVLCVGDEREEVGDTCDYYPVSGVPPCLQVNRYYYEIEARVVEATTAAVITTVVALGEPAPFCPSTIKTGDPCKLTGSHVSFQAVVDAAIDQLSAFPWPSRFDPRTGGTSMGRSEFGIALLSESEFAVVRIRTTDSPLANLDVRRALDYALDYQELQQAAGPFESGVSFPQRLSEAKALLSERGYSDGFTVRLGFYDSPQYGRLVDVIQKALSEAGILAQLHRVEPGDEWERAATDIQAGLGPYEIVVGPSYRLVSPGSGARDRGNGSTRRCS